VGGTKLRIGATTVRIGDPSADGSSGGGSSLINLYITGATSIYVRKGRTGGTSNQPATQIQTDNNASDVTIDEGTVGIGTDVYGETVTLNELIVNGGRVELGEGVTFSGTAPALHMKAGTVVLRGAIATINQDAGSLRTEGTGAITTANIGGTLVANSTGTITTLQVQGAGLADFTQSTAARTVTNATVQGPTARIAADNGKPLTVTFTNGVDFIDGARTTQCDMGDEVNAAYTAA
jgi:hypothetical protein